MNNLTKEEFVHMLRRQSTGSSRGNYKYSEVTQHKCGRWEARMGQFLGKKYVYLGLFYSEIEAAREAVTNFQRSIYEGELVFGADNGGSKYALDLNLGVAPPGADYPNENINMQGFEFQSGPYVFEHGGARMQNSDSVLVATQMPHARLKVSEHSPLWKGMNSSFFSFQKGTALEKSMEFVSSPNRAWENEHRHGGVPPATLFSTAASSRFVNSTAASSSSAAVRQSHYLMPTSSNNHYHLSPI